LRWLAEYLHRNPIETSGARCDTPKRMQRRRIEALKDEKFKCKGKQHYWYGEVRSVLQERATEHRNYNA